MLNSTNTIIKGILHFVFIKLQIFYFLMHKQTTARSRSKDVHLLPYPVLTDDGHYKPFSAVYGTKTTEV